MLLPLDEVPVHVHRFAARAPCDSKGSGCPGVSVESIQPRPPQPCEVGRPKGRRRKNRRNLTVFFKAPTPGRATAWLAQPITADHVKQAASPTRQEHHAQGLKHLSSDRLPQRRMLALRFHRGQLRISLDRSPLAHELWGREKKQFAPRKFLDFFVAPSPRISGFPKHKGSTVAAKVKSGTRAAQDRPDGPGVGSGRVPGRPRASPREELRA